MDVARLMVRTKGVRVVDEVLDTIINGDLFQVRLVEDPFGPMRSIASPAATVFNETAEDDSDGESEEIPTMGDDGAMIRQESNEHSLALNAVTLHAESKEENSNGFACNDEQRENELALIVVNSNPIDVGREFSVDSQGDQSIDSASSNDQRIELTHTDYGPLSVGPYKGGDGTLAQQPCVHVVVGGAISRRANKSVDGPKSKTGLHQTKSGVIN
ncbi:hypothetical protein A2U01_0036601, partial [Trifolium medium]|nr:hypothetical protein [Trifolium medium]